MTRISVIICTYNPRRDYLARVLDAMKSQTLPTTEWELLLVDNASTKVLAEEIDLAWHPAGRHVREMRPGLTQARVRGIAEATGDLLLFVDDDNVLAHDFLTNVSGIYETHPRIGAFGGKLVSEFEVPPEPWCEGFLGSSADFGDEIRLASWEGVPQSSRTYPEFAPIGAGMALRREAAVRYAEAVARDPNRASLDRRGKSLASGGDNDMLLTALGDGWQVGYFPQLGLRHLIPKGRLTVEYLARLRRGINYTWVLVLNVHGIRPWSPVPRWGVLPRKVRAYFTYRAWAGAEPYIRWQGACGMFEGRASLREIGQRA